MREGLGCFRVGPDMHKGSPVLAACVVLFFLHFTPVSPQCRAGTALECQKAHQFVPGLLHAEHGIDITTLDTSHGKLMDLREWQSSGGTCTLCDNPLQKHNKLQKIPVAVTNWKANISCQKKVQHSVPKSVISVAEEITKITIKNDWKTELDVDVKSSANFQRILAGSHSDFTSFAKRKISHNYIFLLHHVSCSYYKFSIDKDKSVSQNFKDQVKVLPEKYDHNSKLDYHSLIIFYGTHFIKEVDLGAAFRFLTALPFCKMQLQEFTDTEISKCLEIQMGHLIGFDKVTKEPDFENCKGTLQDFIYPWGFPNQVTSIYGGSMYLQLNFYNYAFWNDPGDWLESVRSEPGLISYSVEPLHALLDKNDPRRDSLRQAVSAYVRERVLWRNCTPSCPPGVQQSTWDSCSCECPTNDFTNAMCCPQQPGLAKLTVTIKSAKGLWGDYFSRSDAYVKVIFKEKVMCTPTIWNFNNPEWNVNLDFGIIQLTKGYTHLEIQVWDEDVVRDDLLGKCFVLLKAWDSNVYNCHLEQGSLLFKYNFICGPHLGGPICWDYFPFPSWKDRKKYFHKTP
ncbi:perforin-1-like [Tiliqua scincoides]|uniref:perforin-1-like n=1 Tax=Tiliqua scincoides TaxID=71010 RepID=UPI0034626FA9